MSNGKKAKIEKNGNKVRIKTMKIFSSFFSIIFLENVGKNDNQEK